ncbi:E3 ubiquitin-protein ligase RNF34-like [Anneissia japonica]|uniref:E3 ubiquitin-protein ligase RNF34-like n=1 Tax=Anneissia japonica TaxID=1529436 RepID=UPI001425595E|nr:E3 ubiquitin-protein ligase RNF34-like [Anneissia japonica]
MPKEIMQRTATFPKFEDEEDRVVSDHLEKKGQVFSLTNEVLISSIIDFDENGADDRKKDGVEDPSKQESLVSLIAELSLEEDAEDERPERKEEEEGVCAPVESYTNKVRVGGDDDDDEKSRGDLLRELTDLNDEMSCKVCMDRDSNVLLTPCNHLVCCDSCSVRLASCPICRTKVGEVVKV